MRKSFWLIYLAPLTLTACSVVNDDKNPSAMTATSYSIADSQLTVGGKGLASVTSAYVGGTSVDVASRKANRLVTSLPTQLTLPATFLLTNPSKAQSETISELTRLTINGNVGIGTSSPDTNLHIHAASGHGIKFSGTNPFIQSTDFLTLSTTNDVVINTASAERMRVTTGGHVGIGTTTPGALPNWTTGSALRLLEITGDGSATAASTGFLILSNNRSTPTSGDVLGALMFGSRGSPDGRAAAMVSFLEGSGGSNGFGSNLVLYTRNDNTLNYTEKMRISNAGHVGIGTTNPTALLNVDRGTNVFGPMDTDVDVTLQLSSQGATAGQGNFGASLGFSRLNSNGSVGSAIVAVQTSADADQMGLAFFTHSSASTGANLTEAARINHLGNLGVGSNNPTVKLQVGENGDGTSAIANAWSTFSDKRLKEVHGRIPAAMKLIEKINGYYYGWKNGLDRSRHVGVLAQEIETVLPELVSTGTDGIKAVDYSKLSAVLIEATKELSERQRTQAAELQRLEAENARLNGLATELQRWACAKDPGAPFCR